MNPPLDRIYEVLHRTWGPQHWWPARTRMEMIVGAILTQNTAWSNVEKAIGRLRKEHALSFGALHRVPLRTLAGWIRPCGTFNLKARRIKAFTNWVADEFGGRLERLFRLGTPKLRKALLGIHGIGPETADCILLYAGQRSVFVVDAYTRRLLQRHGWAESSASYDEIARFFTKRIPADPECYNEFHALIVQLGKQHCRARPLCSTCPLRAWLPRGGPIMESRNLTPATLRRG